MCARVIPPHPIFTVSVMETTPYNTGSTMAVLVILHMCCIYINIMLYDIILYLCACLLYSGHTVCVIWEQKAQLELFLSHVCIF